MLEEDWIVFACFSEQKMIWWSSLCLGPSGLRAAEFPSPEIEMHFRLTMESVRFASGHGGVFEFIGRSAGCDRERRGRWADRRFGRGN